ncbi:MAG: division plane positioning ATPase MipZ [Xanthobacteraceae bacterium]|uniref:division plane positioning ATPase MipZ n=1 Tax=Pseudolabrys sp. TaxID=1960880 RepID=UPI003D0D5AE0
MRTPRIVVVANEKGGSGKSTIAMHVTVALTKAGERVGSIDLDPRQQSFTQYVENRRRWGELIGRDLGLPEHLCLDNLSDTDAGAALTDAIGRLSSTCSTIVIDTPGHDAAAGRIAHSLATTLVTPLNDSFVDLAVFADVDPETFAVGDVSHYAAMVAEVRSRRRHAGEAPLDWIVLRNRLSSFGTTRNRKLMGAALADLSRTLDFTLVEGLAERMIFREFFPRGLTALDDFDEKTLATRPTMSHATARLEIESLITAILLGRPGVAANDADRQIASVA